MKINPLLPKLMQKISVESTECRLVIHVLYYACKMDLHALHNTALISFRTD